MGQEFKLPDLGEGLTEATLVDWKISEGDHVAKDQVLAELETDKAMAPLPSPFAGKVIRLHWKAGDLIPVGAPLVTFEAAAEVEASSPARVKAPPPPAVPPAQRPVQPVAQPVKPAAELDASRPALAAPATRRLAREKGIDLRQVRGTGPGGRITTDDVLNAAVPRPSRQDGPAATLQTRVQRPPFPDFAQWGEVDRQPATAIRKRVAQRMAFAAQTIAAVTHFDEADVTALEESRAQGQALAQEMGIRLTLLPYVVKAVAAALLRHPLFNASWDDEREEIVYKRYVNVGIAVDSPQGLLVPVIRNANRLRVVELAKGIADLADKAKQGKLTADEMRGGTFTITNLGAIGGTAFTPIVNWPEVAILGLARTQERPMLRDGVLVNRKKLPLALTYDHRLIDGAQAARFVNDLRVLIENPLLVLLES